jgi:hypothetical protein
MYEMEGLLRAHTGRVNMEGLYIPVVAKLQTYGKEVSGNRPVTETKGREGD